MERSGINRGWRSNLLRAATCLSLSVGLIGLAGCGPAAWRWVADEPSQKNYTVQPGDTLYSIAFRNQVDFRDLAWWNGISAPYVISPGKQLVLKSPTLLMPNRPTEVEEVIYEPVSPPVVAKAPTASRPVSRPPKKTVRKKTTAPLKTVKKPTPKKTKTVRRSPSRPAPTGPLPKLGRWNWPVRGALGRTFNAKKGIKGIDILGEKGTSIAAAASGKVVYSGSGLKGYGKLLIIKHSNQYLSAYGHNDRLLVKQGATVKGGQPIAKMGLGPSKKALLHFEIRKKGKPVNPLKFLPGRSG